MEDHGTETDALPNHSEANGNGATPEEIPGVFVYIKQEIGGLQVAFEFVGGFSPLAAPIALEIAAVAARRHVGLS